MSSRRIGIILALSVGAAAAVGAQQAPGEEQQSAAELDQRVRILERKLELDDEHRAEEAKKGAAARADSKGFAIASADGDFQLRFRGYVQVDGRYFQDDRVRPAVDTQVVRRARPILEGTVYKIFDFKIMPDFGGGKSELVDGYVEARFSKATKLRAGKFKPPVGLERLQSARDLVFVERGLPTSLVPNRDIGIQLGGELVSGRLEYQAGVFDGVVDGASGDGDSGDDKELAARIVWKPLARADGTGALADFGVGLAATRGNERGTATSAALPNLRSQSQQSFFAYRSDGTAAGTSVADGRRTRWAPQAWFYRGPFGALAEWVSSEERVRHGSDVAVLELRSWQLQLSWALTGEENTYHGVAPRRPFRPGADGRGAWIVAFRASGLTVDSDAFPVFADPAKAARRATELGASISWNLAPGVRWMLDYDWARFDGGAAGGADRPDTKALFTRFQVAF